MLSEYEKFGPSYRWIGPASPASDTRNLTKMYSDAICESPTGEPFFKPSEVERISELEAQEVIAEAEAIQAASDAIMHFAGVGA